MTPEWFGLMGVWRQFYQARLTDAQRKIVSKCAIIHRSDDMGGTAGLHAGNHSFHVISLSRYLNFVEAKVSYGHELMHLADGVLNNKQGHGESWKALMVQVGLKPQACHKFPLKERKLIKTIMQKLAEHHGKDKC